MLDHDRQFSIFNLFLWVCAANIRLHICWHEYSEAQLLNPLDTVQMYPIISALPTNPRMLSVTPSGSKPHSSSRCFLLILLLLLLLLFEELLLVFTRSHVCCCSWDDRSC
jgi:hypothetical protein